LLRKRTPHLPSSKGESTRNKIRAWTHRKKGRIQEKIKRARKEGGKKASCSRKKGEGEKTAAIAAGSRKRA